MTDFNDTPNSVCWNITNACNDHCAFCYRDQTTPPLSLTENLLVLDNIIAAGIKKVTFAGGEPLLYPDLAPLIRYAKEAGLCTSLTTNGRFLLPDRLAEIGRYLDWLTLSLDAPNAALQAKMTRAADHFDVVENIMAYVHDHDFPFTLKINTVVSKINRDAVVDMIPLMDRYGITRWKLFQFIPLRGNASTNEALFIIDDQTFDATATQICQQLQQDAPHIRCSRTNRTDLESAYFTVFPNGDVRISTDMQDQTVGNLLHEPAQVLWQRNAYDKTGHALRTASAFQGREEDQV